MSEKYFDFSTAIGYLKEGKRIRHKDDLPGEYFYMGEYYGDIAIMSHSVYDPNDPNDDPDEIIEDHGIAMEGWEILSDDWELYYEP